MSSFRQSFPEHFSSQADEEKLRHQRSDYPVLGRRGFVIGAASVLGLKAFQALTSRLHAEERHVPDDPTRVPGAPATPYGQRSIFEQATRLAKSTRSRTPLQDLHGIVTPSALHFERHHNGVPLIHPGHHQLLIRGVNSYYHYNGIQSWKVHPDGKVTNIHV